MTCTPWRRLTVCAPSGRRSVRRRLQTFGEEEVALIEVKRSATGDRGLPKKEGMVSGRRHKRKLARRDAA